MARIVVTSYRYKRPPPKKKPRAVEVAATVVVHQPKPESDGNRARPKAKQPTTTPPTRPPLPTIVVATNQKRLKRLLFRPQCPPRRTDTAAQGIRIKAMSQPLAKSSIAHKAAHELKQYAVISLYLYVCFGAMLLYKGAVLRAEGIDYATYGLAAIKALILAKFMLIGHALRIGDRHTDRRLMQPILRKSFVFLGLLVVLDVIEEVGVGALHGRSVTEAFAGIADGSWLEILATCIILFLILVPYFAYREVDRILGERRLFRMMFLDSIRRSE